MKRELKQNSLESIAVHCPTAESEARDLDAHLVDWFRDALQSRDCLQEPAL